MTGVITRGSRKVAGYNGGGEGNNDGGQRQRGRQKETHQKITTRGSTAVPLYSHLPSLDRV